MKKSSVKNSVILIFFASLLFLFIFIYIKPDIQENLKDSYYAKYGKIFVADKTDIYVIRDEVVYFADKNGTIKADAKEGEKVRKNTKILTISPNETNYPADESIQKAMNNFDRFNSGDNVITKNEDKINAGILNIETLINREDTKELARASLQEVYQRIQIQNKKNHQKKEETEKISTKELDQAITYTQSMVRQNGVFQSKNPGIVSYSIDGFENVLSPYTMTLLDKNKMEKQDFSGVSEFREGTGVNQPVFKLLNSENWYIVCWLDKNKQGKYEKNMDIEVDLPFGPVQGTVFDIIEGESDFMLIMKFHEYYEKLPVIRKEPGEIILKNQEGVIIENRSIVIKDGRQGVYVITVSGELVFKPINVLATDGLKSAVSNDFYTEMDGEKTIRVETINLYDKILGDGSKASDLKEGNQP